MDSKEGTFKEPDLRDKERAAIKIQAHYKGYHARKEYKNHLNTTNAVAETLSQRHRESIEIRVQLFESPTALPKATTILLTPEAALETLREGAVQKQQPRTATRESSSSSLQQTADRCLLAQETEQEREEDAARLPQMAAKSLQPAEEEGVGQTSSREQNTNTNANLGGRIPSPSDVLVSEWDQLPEILSSGPASEEDGDANCKKDESNGDQQSEETVSLGEARAKGDVVGDRSWNSGVQCNGDSSKGDSDAVSNGDQQCENSLLPGNTGDALVNEEVTEDRSETAVEDKIQSNGGVSLLGGDNGHGSDAASIVEGSNKDGTQDHSDDDTIRSETAAVLKSTILHNTVTAIQILRLI